MRSMRHADLIIVYTCGGFQVSEERSLQTMRRALDQKKKNTNLVVTGCLVKINPKILGRIGNSHVLKHQELHRLDDIIRADIPYEGVPDANIVRDVQDLHRSISPLKKFLSESKFKRTFLKRLLRFIKQKAQGGFADEIYKLKIANGCRGNCTYCAIKLARGRIKSKPIDQILEEFEKGLFRGYKRFMLTAEDTGCYGLDIGTNIVNLLWKLFDADNSFSLIISDFNPNWLVKYYDDLLSLFIENKDRIEEIRTPIQSGSDRILRLMRRPYRIDRVKKVLYDLSAKLPKLKVRTHILVGFPGETEFDFEQSRQLLQELDIAEVSVYCYEERPGTRAFFMPDKVPLDTRRERTLVLKNIQPDRMHHGN